MNESPRDYFARLKRLIAYEEEEEDEEIRTGFLDLSSKEREFRGKALLGLVLREKLFSPAGHRLARFELAGGRPLPLFSLETGDIVSVFRASDGEIPTGTVYEKDATSVTVALSREIPESFAEGPGYELHRSLNRVTYRRMREALDAVSESQNTPLARLRDISFARIAPAADPAEAGRIEWMDPSLNESQRLAVCKSLASKDIFLVHGPPGTGKTTVLLEIIRQEILRGRSVFVAAPSNTACDNLLERLTAKGVRALRIGHPARISEPLREHTLDFRLALHPLGAEIVEAEREIARLHKRRDRLSERGPEGSARRDISARIHECRSKIRLLRGEIFTRVLDETEVIVGTPAGIEDRAIADFRYQLVVIDEATQATEPLCWIPIAKGKKIVMAGDHFQLPPTIRSPKAQAEGLGRTLFERFYEVLGDASKQLLERQYRMHEKIMGFSSRQFYSGALVADDSVRSHVLADLKGVREDPETSEPLIFLDTAGKSFEERLEEGSESRYNAEEAEAVLAVLQKMLSLGVAPEDIAVISPYSAQVRLLASRTPHPGVEIDSVDGFQGREKELVIVSLVRSNVEGEMGFLTDTRRMNVAMTRARRKLIVVGDSGTIASIPFYRDFLKYAENTGAYRTLWEWETG